MAPPATYEEGVKILTWQLLRLTELGFSVAEAEALLQPGRSWHDVAELVAAGATSDQVKRILL